MAEGEQKYNPKERIRQELSYHAENSVNNFIDYALRAAYGAQDGHEVVAMNFQSLSDISSNDAIQAAFESGQVYPNQEAPKTTQEDFLNGAGLLMDQSQYCAFDAANYFIAGNKDKGSESLKNAKTLANQALVAATMAGRLQKDGKRDGIIPILTLDPSDPNDL